MWRSAGKNAGLLVGVICPLMETVTPRLPSADEATNCVYPSVFPVWPYIVPQLVTYLNTPRPA